jgi:hypothetical protein
VEPITSPEQFAGLALLKIGRAKTAAELATLKADCDSAIEYGDITDVEYSTLLSAYRQRKSVVVLLDAIRAAKDGVALDAVGKAAKGKRDGGELTLAQFEEVVRAGRARRAELNGGGQP